MKNLVLAVSVMTFAASVVGLTSSNASAGAYCGRAPASDIDHSDYVTADANTKIHTGSDVDCTAVGLLSAGQRADYYCYTINPSSNLTWTYLRDVATGKKGWVRDDTLPKVNNQHGSGVYCGF